MMLRDPKWFLWTALPFQLLSLLKKEETILTEENKMLYRPKKQFVGKLLAKSFSNGKNSSDTGTEITHSPV